MLKKIISQTKKQSEYLSLWHVNLFIPNPSYTLQAMVFKRSSWIFYLQQACNVSAWIWSPFSRTLLVNGTQLVASMFLGPPVGDKVTAVQFHPSNHRGRTERCYQRESSLSFALLYWQVGPLVGWKQPWKNGASAHKTRAPPLNRHWLERIRIWCFCRRPPSGPWQNCRGPTWTENRCTDRVWLVFKVGEEEEGGPGGRLVGGVPCPVSCQHGVHLKAKEIKAP